MDGQKLLASFVEDMKLIAWPAPEPSPMLAAFFAKGVSTEKGDLLATAASNVPGPAT